MPRTFDRKVLRVINKYMNKNKVDFELQVKIRKYLEHLWLVEEIENQEIESDIMNRLSVSLREELLIQSHGKVLARFDLFNNVFSEDVLEKVSQVVEIRNYAPDDIIYYEGEPSNNLIYFIIKGEVEIFHESARRSSSTTLRILKEGECFGQLSFFTERDRDISAKSLGFSSLYVLKREDFLQIIHKSPSDFENFHMIKDKINLYGDTSRLGLICESCSNPKHQFKDCPFLKYVPNHELVIRKHILSENQKRKFKRRKRKKTLSALIIKKDIPRIVSDSDEMSNSKCSSDEGNLNIPMLDGRETEIKEKFLNLEAGEPHESETGSYKDTPPSKNEIKLPRPSEIWGHEVARRKLVDLDKKKKTVMFGPLVEENECNSFPEHFEDSVSPKASFIEPERREGISKTIRKGTIKGLGTRKEELRPQRTSNEYQKIPNNNEEEFGKNIAFIFGGLNIDLLQKFKVYFPYNNCNHVVDFINKKNERKSLFAIDIHNKNKNLLNEKNRISGAFGLIEFRNQQKHFLKNKGTSGLRETLRSKSPKRGPSVFNKRSSNFGFLELVK